MKAAGRSLFFHFLVCFALATPFGPKGLFAEDYLPVNGPCELVFPRDHGSHPGHRLEWWYYTGNVATPAGRSFGFQLTFFRTRISPPGAEKEWPERPSAWRTSQIFFGHTAVSDLKEARFYHDERMARGAVGLAGVTRQDETTRVFLGPCSALLAPYLHQLKANTGHFDLDLSCRPLKPPVPHGSGGYSLKGENPESASCYYSFTRLETSGTLTVRGEPLPVRGTAWMDHEFSSAPLEKDIQGWDWFGVQLEDRTELMIYLLRRRGGGYSRASSGTFVTSSGEVIHLAQGDFRIQITEHWKSVETGALYPSRWRIRVFPLALELEVVPNLADQELTTEKTTRVSYWEGSVSVKGRSGQKTIHGKGYVELTGYARPFSLIPR